ncbi:hypothetical protein BB561_002844 [Smittium simulii]|uniref:Uncharacterized protein n=1 Tax=Smittium simulii TaxID=133385 RepID=A0A2T9YNX5_9FUNG|nr:hypothetical protein BB561_002844 [Smittium simulii]
MELAVAWHFYAKNSSVKKINLEIPPDQSLATITLLKKNNLVLDFYFLLVFPEFSLKLQYKTLSFTCSILFISILAPNSFPKSILAPNSFPKSILAPNSFPKSILAPNSFKSLYLLPTLFQISALALVLPFVAACRIPELKNSRNVFSTIYRFFTAKFLVSNTRRAKNRLARSTKKHKCCTVAQSRAQKKNPSVFPGSILRSTQFRNNTIDTSINKPCSPSNNPANFDALNLKSTPKVSQIDSFETTDSKSIKLGTDLSRSIYLESTAGPKINHSTKNLNQLNAKKCLNVLKNINTSTGNTFDVPNSIPRNCQDDFSQYFQNDNFSSVSLKSKVSSLLGSTLPPYKLLENSITFSDTDEPIITYSQIFPKNRAVNSDPRTNTLPNNLQQSAILNQLSQNKSSRKNETAITLNSQTYSSVALLLNSSSLRKSKKSQSYSKNLPMSVFRVNSSSNSKPYVKNQPTLSSFPKPHVKKFTKPNSQYSHESEICSAPTNRTNTQVSTFQTASCLITEHNPLSESSISNSSIQSFRSL